MTAGARGRIVRLAGTGGATGATAWAFIDAAHGDEAWLTTLLGFATLVLALTCAYLATPE